MAQRIGALPKTPKNTSRKRAKAAADKADQMVSGAGSAPKDQTPAGDPSEGRETAPAFGSNEPDEGVFLHHVQILVSKDAEIDVVKEQLKGMKKVRRSLRDEAGAAGIAMGELDRAVKDAQTEQVDLEARERRYLTYMKWLGCPLDIGAPKPPPTKKADIKAAESNRWHQEGYRLGILGKPRAIPEGCPGEHHQAVLKGHEAGQEALMRSSKLTAGAFTEKPLAAPPEPAEEGGVLTLGLTHFQSGYEIEDLNLKTLLPGWKERFQNAASVVVIVGDRRRILKEENYIDTGEPDAPVSEPEPVLDAAPAEEPEPTESFA